MDTTDSTTVKIFDLHYEVEFTDYDDENYKINKIHRNGVDVSEVVWSLYPDFDQEVNEQIVDYMRSKEESYKDGFN